MKKTNNYFSYSTLLFFLTVLASNALAEGAKKIVKWKDDRGVTHYGDVLPSQEAGRGNAELSKEGVIVKKNESYRQTDEANRVAESANAEQIRKDSALLASYSSVEEIDLAMGRNLQTEENSLKSLHQRLTDAQSYLNNKRAQHDGMIKNKKSPPPYLVDEIKSYRQKIAKIEADITSTENNIGLIQRRFANYKNRYAELRPRNQSLSSINVNRKTLAELEGWKRDANQRLSFYLNETVKFKRAGAPVPNEVTTGISQANQEIARADQEIASIMASIKDSQQTFSSK